MLHIIGFTEFAYEVTKSEIFGRCDVGAYLENIADEFGCGWLCSHPLSISNKESNFQTSRGWNQTKWIVVSSMFFSIPAVWHLTNYYLYVVYKREGYISSQVITDENEEYIQTVIYVSVILLSTSLISANYWRNATRGWRRNLDLLFAKFSFLIGCYYGIKYITYIPYLVINSFIIILLPYVYGKSTKFVSENNTIWVKYHFTFHILLTIGVAVLLDGIRLRINE